jgi:hypothetical protein
MARYDHPNPFGTDVEAMFVSRIARAMLDLFGADAPLRLKEEANQAVRVGDSSAAHAWLDVAEAVQDLILQRFLHSNAVRLARQSSSARSELCQSPRSLSSSTS